MRNWHYYGLAEKILRLPSLERFEKIIVMPSDESGRRKPFAHADLKPTIAMWAKKPLRFGAAYRSQLKHSRQVSVYLNANVTEILLNASGTAVEALNVVSLRGKRFRIKAKRFVLACGGLENARLLLVSRGVQGNGIGNQYDVVGRYFMDHPRAVFGKIKLFGPHKFHPVGMSLSWGHGPGRHSSSLRRRKSARRYSIII